MKTLLPYLFVFLVLNFNTTAQQVVGKPELSKREIADTDSIIVAIVDKKQKPSEEKVQYFSRLTRYGFKNLFQKNAYNATLPYSQQVNPHAETYMQDYLNHHSKYLTGMKSWGMPYFNLIDNIFSQYGLPKELKYLAVIESNLSTAATSWVGAGGPWQFMPYTARDYGLVVSSGYDERRDYVKSTHAAARYLLTLYKQMHDWLLVIAAYNGGPGRVNTAIKKSGSKNFWSLQYYLPEESRNHVKKFIATHYIMEGAGGVTTGAAADSYSPGEFSAGNNPYNSKPILSIPEMENAETQTISGKFNSLIIAKNIAMDISSFNKFNPNFDQQLNANGQFELILPQDKMQLFLATKYQILNECVQLLLSDDNIPDNKTVYPKKYKRRS